MMTAILLAGPVQAGKTTYLACLLRAAFAAEESRIRVTPDAGSPAALDLQEYAAALLCGTPLPATLSAGQYGLVVILPGSRLLFGWGESRVTLTAVDPPGGDCLPPAGHPLHADVLRAARGAEGLLLLLPPDRGAGDLAGRIRAFGEAVKAERGRPGPAFTRVAVALTMAERLGGVGTAGDLDNRDPRSAVEGLHRPEVMRAIADLVPTGGDWYTLVSALGFDANTGRPAAIEVGGHWALPRGHGLSERDAWRPYRPFEPLEFLVRGVCWQEEWGG